MLGVVEGNSGKHTQKKRREATYRRPKVKADKLEPDMSLKNVIGREQRRSKESKQTLRKTWDPDTKNQSVIS